VLAGVTVVPIIESYADEQIRQILELTQADLVFCSGDKASKIEKLHPNLGNLVVVSFDPSPSGDYLLFKEAISKGEALEGKLDEVEITESTPYTLCFTSGTTGAPKGAIITHRNVAAAVGGDLTLDPDFRQKDSDTYFSFLPLAHILERYKYVSCIAFGVTICFYAGDPMKIRDDILVAKPTLMSCVPRILTKWCEVIKEEEGPAFLGGNLRYIMVGGAACSLEVKRKLSSIIKCPIVDGYG